MRPRPISNDSGPRVASGATGRAPSSATVTGVADGADGPIDAGVAGEGGAPVACSSAFARRNSKVRMARISSSWVPPPAGTSKRRTTTRPEGMASTIQSSASTSSGLPTRAIVAIEPSRRLGGSIIHNAAVPASNSLTVTSKPPAASSSRRRVKQRRALGEMALDCSNVTRPPAARGGATAFAAAGARARARNATAQANPRAPIIHGSDEGSDEEFDEATARAARAYTPSGNRRRYAAATLRASPVRDCRSSTSIIRPIASAT